MGSRWLYTCSSDVWMMSTLYSVGSKFGCSSRTSYFSMRGTTLDLDITAGLISAGFMIIGSDVPSLLIMSLKMRK